MTTEATLIAEYQSYLAQHDLPELSADELLSELFYSPPGRRDPQVLAHCEYLQNFIDRWEAFFDPE